ncbi:MAG: dynamin family protein [Deltaproteobacteria bacterium]|nr:dynamin family protein [Deltaproteobacteria bacterium]
MNNTEGTWSFDGNKAALTDVFLRLAGLAEQIGLASTARDIRDVRLPKLEQERFSLVVLGEFNRGKSTLINALIGQRLLPAAATPTTAALAELRQGETFSATAVFDDGTRLALDRSALDGYLTGKVEPTPAVRVDRIEIVLPATVLANNLTIVDTPGVNDLSQQRADVTYGYLPRADAIVFLLDGTQVLSASERRFLQERVLKAARERLIFVVTKCDLLDEAERADVIGFAKQELLAVVPDPTLIEVSAKRALAGDVAGSGIEALQQAINRVLGDDRQRVLVEHGLDDAARLSRFLRQTLGMRQSSLELSDDELQSKVAQARVRLEDGRAALAQASLTIAAEASALKARVDADRRELVEALCARLPGEIEAQSAAEVERYLAPFLEDTFRTWLELQGKLVAQELERIAEAAVSVATERLDAVSQDVATALGHARDTLQVPRPTQSYEASVFALGALGTTALLFVNVLAGGALALLTPALASLARARAARSAVGQAARKSPELVRGIGDDLGVRLGGVIDDFANRLDGFIGEAGASLAQGIAEVLERALAERRTGQALAEQEALLKVDRELKGVDERVIELRQALWRPM